MLLPKSAVCHFGKRRVLCLAVIVCLGIYMFWSNPKSSGQLKSWVSTSDDAVGSPPRTEDGVYQWNTLSDFNPVRMSDVARKSIDQLCASFPRHLLQEMQPILKTGHGLLEEQLRPHLKGVSACIDNKIIFSDLQEEFEGHQVFDIIADVVADLPRNLTYNNTELTHWKELNEAAANGTVEEYKAVRKVAWTADKFKFLPATSRAWKMRPDRRWYVFYETDTYVVWDNLFRLLHNFDPEEPLYFGSPSPGAPDQWFANGGPGYILSRGAMKKLVDGDWDHKTGEYLGTKITEEMWHIVMNDCCGDSILGIVLAEKNVTLSGIWPMFNPHPPHMVPFTEREWCQPMITMHKPLIEDVMQLWRWEWTQRQVRRPLTYRDLAISYYDFPNLPRRPNWDNGRISGFPAPVPSEFYSHDPHGSVDSCEAACKSHKRCFQWNYHLRQCWFLPMFRVGRTRQPETGKEQSEEDRAKTWNSEDLKFTSGWDKDKIRTWINEHPCENVEWVRPSTERIF